MVLLSVDIFADLLYFFFLNQDLQVITFSISVHVIFLLNVHRLCTKGLECETRGETGSSGRIQYIFACDCSKPAMSTWLTNTTVCKTHITWNIYAFLVSCRVSCEPWSVTIPWEVASPFYKRHYTRAAHQMSRQQIMRGKKQKQASLQVSTVQLIINKNYYPICLV